MALVTLATVAMAVITLAMTFVILDMKLVTVGTCTLVTVGTCTLCTSSSCTLGCGCTCTLCTLRVFSGAVLAPAVATVAAQLQGIQLTVPPGGGLGGGRLR